MIVVERYYKDVFEDSFTFKNREELLQWLSTVSFLAYDKDSKVVIRGA